MKKSIFLILALSIVLNCHSQSAKEYLDEANLKFKLQNYQGAIEDYNKAIEINPNEAEAYYNRGISKDSLKDYQGAINDFSKAIEINPVDGRSL